MPVPRSHSMRWLLAAGALVLLLAAGWFLRHVDVKEESRHMLEWFRDLGLLGHLFFFILLALIIPLMIPNTIFELGAGILFPYPLGLFYVIAGESAGSALAFWLGRHALRGRARTIIAANQKVRLISRTLTHDGWKTVLLTRMIPMFPFKFSNYAFGLTELSLGEFIFGNTVGIIPRAMATVYIGLLIGDIADLGKGRVERTPAEVVLMTGGLIVGLLVLWISSRLAVRAFRHHLDQETREAAETLPSRND